MLSNSLGVPLLVHPRRNVRSHLFDIMAGLFSRQDILNKVDKELVDYYEKINTELGRNLLKFKYPVLIDMICEEKNAPVAELENAINLRSDRNVVAFREQMHEIEQIINLGNTQEILAELKLVSDLAKEITTKYERKISLGEFSISLTPSISVPINVSKSKKNDVHATFIRELLDYGVYKRQYI